jgi:hypothetical protein
LPQSAGCVYLEVRLNKLRLKGIRVKDIQESPSHRTAYRKAAKDLMITTRER